MYFSSLKNVAFYLSDTLCPGLCLDGKQFHIQPVHIERKSTFTSLLNESIAIDLDLVDSIEDPNYNVTAIQNVSDMSKVQKQSTEAIEPENFVQEGALSVDEIPQNSKSRPNKRKIAKVSKDKGEKYKNVKGETKIGRKGNMLPRCQGETCQRVKKECKQISDEDRIAINSMYYNLGNLRLQRQFLVNNTKSKPKATCKVSGGSRRSSTVEYFLPINNLQVPVCKKLFLSTFGIKHDQQLRTALKKTNSGIVEEEKRGGRSKSTAEKDKKIKEAVTNHILRFPVVDSHYCRKSSTKRYVQPGLTKALMHNMYKEEKTNEPCSYTYYCQQLKNLNISIHKPKKDMCGLCKEILEKGVENVEEDMLDKYNEHVKEKDLVRQAKLEAKELTALDNSVGSAIYDLQQVIYTPQSNHSSIFYKRRLANYNLTIYNLKNKEGSCHVWHEGIAKRGACEIATCLRKYLVDSDNSSVKKIILFSDGCFGQNKNSLIPCMVRDFLRTSENVEEVTQNFFEVDHGQSECDSVHSTIEKKINLVGDIELPVELHAIIRGAKSKKPLYKIEKLTTSEVLDWRSASATEQLLKTRTSDTGKSISWQKMKVWQLKKSQLDKIYFKELHSQENFDAITFPKRRTKKENHVVLSLYSDPPKLSSEKYNDIKKLCTGTNAVVKNPDSVNFYLSLPHCIK